MPDLTEANLDDVVAACRENAEEIAQSFNRCLNRNDRIEIGAQRSWEPNALPEELNGPGLVVAFEIGDQAMICLIPASLPLPPWYSNPGDSEESRLQTLALEWSLNLLPPDLEAGQFRTTAFDNLKSEAVEESPGDWAVLLELCLFDDSEPSADSPEAEPPSEVKGDSEPDQNENPGDQSSATVDAEQTTDGETESKTGQSAAAATDSSESSAKTTDQPAETAATGHEPVAKLYVVWPITKPSFHAAEQAAGDAHPDDAAIHSAAAGGSSASEPSVSTGMDEASRRLLRLPVTVTVRLAEKRIELGTLLSLTPGALVTFSTSCEELLDLYVNNHFYGRGEAVKIGEKFGLKISDVNVKVTRQPSIINID